MEEEAPMTGTPAIMLRNNSTYHHGLAASPVRILLHSRYVIHVSATTRPEPTTQTANSINPRLMGRLSNRDEMMPIAGLTRRRSAANRAALGLRFPTSAM